LSRIRVHHQGLVACQGESDQFLRPGIPTQTRTDRHDVGTSQSRNQVGRRVQWQADQLRSAGDNGHQILGRGGDRHQPCPGPQTGLPAQAHGSGHAHAAANDEHPAEITLVRLARPPWQGLHDTGFRDALQTRAELRDIRHRNFQVIKENAPRALRPLAQEQPGLQTHEGHRRIRPHGFPQRHAAVGVQAGRDIDGKHRSAGAIDGADGIGRSRAHRLRQTGAQYRIHDDLALAQQGIAQGFG
jgi:hypothetical protein